MQIAIAALFLIVFAGLAIAGGKTWRWWHVALLVLVLLAAAGYMSVAAMALRTNVAWNRVREQLEERIAQETAKLEALRYPSLQRPGQSVPEARGELGRMILDRGRIWRGVTPVNVEGDTITLNTSGWGSDACARLGIEVEEDFLGDFVEGEEGNAPEPVAARPHGIEQGVVLIAYLQVPISELEEAHRKALFRGSKLPELDTEGVCHVPAFYLGDYKVTATTVDTVSLQPVTKLAPDQVDVITNSIGKQWALYELMPIDRHDIFAGLPEMHVDAPAPDETLDADAEDYQALGLQKFSGYTIEELRALFPQSAMNLPDAEYEALIQEYAKDQRPIGPNESYPKERLLKKVRFLQNYSVDVDVTQPDPGIERSYDPSGRAQLPHLRHGEAITFKKDDVSGYMDAAAADELIRNGIATDVEDTTAIYTRPLRDYLYSFREHEFQMSQLDQQIAIIQEDQKSVLAATDKLRKQIEYRTSERNDLTQDLSGFTRELTAVKEYQAALEKTRSEQRQQLSQLYRRNREIQERLEAAGTTAANR